jgi:hypothetical protein
MRVNGQDYLDEPDGSEGGPTGKLLAATLLPIVRAAMARGEGPPSVLKWVQRHGQWVTGHDRWTSADETRARVLARRLAETLNDCRRSDAMTHQDHLTCA